MRKRLFILSLFLLYLLFSVYAARAIWTFKSKPDSSGEVALILGTAVIGDEPSVVYQARINHALDLYKSGRVHKLLFSGGKGNVKRLSEAEAGKLFALKAGIAESDIWIEDRSVNTEQNFKFSKAILEEMKVKEVVVISDPLHMRRAIFLAEKYGIKAESSATPFSFFDTNRKKLFFLLMELPKYQLSRLKHLFG